VTYRTVFLAYWDSGFVALDLTDPLRPTLLGDTDYAPDEDGDAHSSSYDDARQLLFTADEDFCKNSGPDIERGLGYLRVYDFTDRANPVQIGEYRTPNSLGIGAVGPATTRSTTRCWSARPCTPRGTPTGSGYWT
jgi:hypothetical protein